MPRLYLDSDVGVQAAELLRAGSHDVLRAWEVHLDKASDDAQLLFAAQEQRILVTHNRTDFLLLHSAWRRRSTAWQSDQPHTGVLIVPQYAPVRMARLVHDFLSAELSSANQLYRYRVNQPWEHHP